MSNFPSTRYPFFSPKPKVNDFVDIKSILSQFDPGSDTKPVELAQIVFKDEELGKAVAAYIERYGLNFSPADYLATPPEKNVRGYKDRRSEDFCGSVEENPIPRTSDIFYPYRIILTAGVIAGAARDNDDGKYAVLFDYLWDFYRKPRHSKAAEALENSAYISFVKEKNLTTIVELFEKIKLTNPNDQIQIDIQVDTAGGYAPKNDPDKKYRYTIRIQGFMNGNVGVPRAAFMIGYHISAQAAKWFEGRGIPLSYDAYSDTPFIGGVSYPSDNRHVALLHYITGPAGYGPETRLYRDKATEFNTALGKNGPSSFANVHNSYACRKNKRTQPVPTGWKQYEYNTYGILFIDTTTAPHTDPNLEKSEEVRNIPFAEFIGLLKNKSMKNFERIPGLSPTTKNYNKNTVDFSSMQESRYYADGYRSLKKANSMMDINRKGFRGQLVRDFKAQGGYMNAVSAYDLLTKYYFYDKRKGSRIPFSFDYSKPIYAIAYSGNETKEKFDPISVIELKVKRFDRVEEEIAGKKVVTFVPRWDTPKSDSDVVESLKAIPFCEVTLNTSGQPMGSQPSSGSSAYSIFQIPDGKSIPDHFDNPYEKDPAAFPFIFYPADSALPAEITIPQLLNETLFPVPVRAMALDGLRRKWGRANVKPSHPRHMIRLGGMVGYPNFLHQI